MDEIRDWMVSRGAHAYSNVLCVIVMGRAEPDGWILDVNRRRAWNLRGLLQELDSVEELRGRPKLMLLHTYPTGTQTTAPTHIPCRYPNYCCTHTPEVPKLLFLHTYPTGTQTTPPTHTHTQQVPKLLFLHTYPTGTQTTTPTHIPHRYPNYCSYTHTPQVSKLLLLHTYPTSTQTTAPAHIPNRYPNYCSYTHTPQVPKLLLLHT